MPAPSAPTTPRPPGCARCEDRIWSWQGDRWAGRAVARMVRKDGVSLWCGPGWLCESCAHAIEGRNWGAIGAAR